MDKNEIMEIILNLMKSNNENFEHIGEYEDKSYAKGYAEGVHDGYLDILNQLGIDLPEEHEEFEDYYN